jgi:hypothetical protein
LKYELVFGEDANKDFKKNKEKQKKKLGLRVRHPYSITKEAPMA